MDQTAAIAIATVLAGAVGVPIVQGIKSLVEAGGRQLEGLPAFYVTVGVSIVLAVASMWIAGAFQQAFTVYTLGAVIAGVFMVATVIYKTLASKINPPATPVQYHPSDY